MTKLLKKMICCLIILTIVSTIFANVNLSPLYGMDKISYESESYEDIIGYLQEEQNKIDIYTIGNADLSNTIEYSIEKSSGFINDTMEIKNIRKSKDINLSNLKQKKDNDETKAIVVGRDKYDEFFNDSNLDNIEKILDMGYSIYFYVDNGYQRYEVYSKLGILDEVKKSDNVEEKTNAFAAYVIKNKIDEYHTGLLILNEGESAWSDLVAENEFDAEIPNKSDAEKSEKAINNNESNIIEKEKNSINSKNQVLLYDIVENRNLYNSYKDVNLYHSKLYKNSNNMIHASTGITGIGDAWNYYFTSDKVHMSLVDYYIDSGNIQTYGTIASTTIFTTTAYMTANDAAKSHYYLIHQRVTVKANHSGSDTANRHTTWLTCEFEANLLERGYDLIYYGPETQPKSTSIKISLGVGADSKGISGNVGISWDIPKNDIEVISGNSNIGNNYANIQFKYWTDILGYGNDYTKGENTQQVTYVFKDNNKRGYALSQPKVTHQIRYHYSIWSSYSIWYWTGNALLFYIPRPGVLIKM